MQHSNTSPNYPISHFLLAIGLSVGLAFYFFSSQGAESNERITTEGILLQVKEEAVLASLTQSANKGIEKDHRQPVAPAPIEKKTPKSEPVSQKYTVWDADTTALLKRKVEKVRSGDNLAVIFARLKIPARQLQLVLDSNVLSKRLRRIYPGHNLEFLLNNTNELVQLTYQPSPLETLKFRREGNSFNASFETREPNTSIVYQQATIDSSLFLAGQNIGFNDDLTLRLAHIFQWDIDFVLDIRKDDQFYVVFEERYLDGNFLGYGQILAAEFKNQNKVYRAVRYTDDNGQSDYYNPEGDNMRKAFLRAPLEFSRISSNFNPRRLHPIRKRVSPHRGIDYAAPTGTPILAAGDGKVIAAQKSRPNGNYVFIQHGEQFQTKYLHLSKFARGVRRGKKVSQGQVIGYVGSTGWATAAHLHYEFLVNGVHKNPRTVKLPKADAISSAERANFMLATSGVLDLLDHYKEVGSFQKTTLPDSIISSITAAP